MNEDSVQPQSFADHGFAGEHDVRAEADTVVHGHLRVRRLVDQLCDGIVSLDRIGVAQSIERVPSNEPRPQLLESACLVEQVDGNLPTRGWRGAAASN